VGRRAEAFGADHQNRRLGADFLRGGAAETRDERSRILAGERPELSSEDDALSAEQRRGPVRGRWGPTSLCAQSPGESVPHTMMANKIEVNRRRAGDIGGTKTLLGLFDAAPVRPRPITIQSFSTLDYGDLPSLIEAFLSGHRVDRKTIDRASFGV